MNGGTGGHAKGDLFGRLRPADTAINDIFNAVNLQTEITLILAPVIPSESGTVNLHIYHDRSGGVSGVYTDSNIIFSTQLTRYGASDVIFQAQHPGSGIMMRPGDFLGVSTSIANSCNISLYGITETLAERVR